LTIIVRWLGHASFQITAEGKIIYVDLEKDSTVREKADVILVTHSHFDHCDPAKIQEAQQESTVTIGPQDCVEKVSGKTKALKAGEEARIDSIQIKAVEAYNYKRFRSPGNPYHPRGFGIGFVIKAEGKSIYHAGDTDFIPEMKQLGHIDIALLPSGGTYTMDNAEASKAAIAINPGIAVPMHRWDTDANEFRATVEEHSETRVELLKKDQRLSIP
jgi:L-ascorbate metabolism protein UlaG (beta-lactamase superfamily)